MTISKRAALAGLLLSLSPSIAVAHAKLVSADPAQDATLAASPARVHLVFSEPVDLQFSTVAITGGDTKAVATGALSHGEKNEPKAVDVPVTAALAPGKYKVEWRMLSADGHKIKGSYDFTIKP